MRHLPGAVSLRNNGAGTCDENHGSSLVSHDAADRLRERCRGIDGREGVAKIHTLSYRTGWA